MDIDNDSQQEVTKNDVFDEEDNKLLAENQALRKLLISQLTSDGKSVPMDKADKNLLVALMNGVDTSIYTKARVKVASGAEKSMNDFTELARQVILNHRNTPRVFTPASLEPPPELTFRDPVPGDDVMGLVNLKPEDLDSDD